MSRVIKTLLILIATLALASAYVGGIRFNELVATSDLIAVAQITKITGGQHSRHAEAKIIDLWKGPRLNKVVFMASPTWTCDISDAQLNESALLFLVKGD